MNTVETARGLIAEIGTAYLTLRTWCGQSHRREAEDALGSLSLRASAVSRMYAFIHAGFFVARGPFPRDILKAAIKPIYTGGDSMEIFQELLELKWYTIVILVALILLGIAFYKTAKQGSFLNTKRLSYAAMCLAISFVLSCIKLYRFPQGGSITPGSMLPMVAFALACGPAEGAVVGMALGLLGLIQDPYIVAPLQVLVDYPLASAAIALGGFAAYLPVKKVWKLPIAVVLGTIGPLHHGGHIGRGIFRRICARGSIRVGLLFNL